MSSHDPKVARPAGSSGGDTLEVRSGGTVKIFSAGSGGGKLTPSSGSQAAHIANAPTSTGATFSTTAAQETKVNAIATKLNSALVALRGIGVLATSA